MLMISPWRKVVPSPWTYPAACVLWRTT